MTDFTPADAPTSNIRVGEVFSRGFEVLFGDFGQFIVLTVITWSPYLVFMLFGLSSGEPGVAALAGLGLTAVLWGVLTILGQAAILYGAVQKMRGQDFTIGASLARGFARFFPILGLFICLGIGVGLGFILLIIPGIILAIMWYVALPACVVEGLGPIESLQRSGFLTKGNRWRIFGIAVVIYIVNTLVQLVVGQVLSAVAGQVVSVIGVFAWMSLVQAYSAIVVAVAYHDLRVVREGADIDQIAAVFD